MHTCSCGERYISEQGRIDCEKAHDAYADRELDLWRSLGRDMMRRQRDLLSLCRRRAFAEVRVMTLIVCPPPCSSGRRCRERVLCTPETCPYGQKGYKHDAHCIKHICAHDFTSGPTVEFDGGLTVTASCVCGMTAFGHDMRYGP